MATNETSPAHTKGPWRTDWLGTDRGWILDQESNYLAEIVTEDDCGFVVSQDQQQANARFIVRACNSHEALLDACKMLLKVLVQDCDAEEFGPEISQAEAVINDAEHE